MHRVVWQRPASFKQICLQYRAYILTHYNNATIIFDGYNGEPSTKDEEHLRRIGTTYHTDISVEDSIQVTLNQSEFLSNERNKMRLISLLSSHLREAKCTVLQAKADADVLIVSTAIEEAKKQLEVILIGEDTDLLVLLIALAPSNTCIKMLMPGTKNRPDKIYNIGDIQNGIGEMRETILVIHAFTGCDTVSSVYRKGKVAPLKKIRTDLQMQECLKVFNNSNASADAVAAAGEVLFFFYLYMVQRTKNAAWIRCAIKHI